MGNEDLSVRGILVAIAFTIFCCLALWPDKVWANDTMYVSFGNIDGSPIDANISDITYIDVFCKTSDDSLYWPGDMHLPLGANDLYVDSLFSLTYGEFHDGILLWDEYLFLQPDHSPPNPPGWSSQSFLGFADLIGSPNPLFHPQDWTRIMTFAIRMANDSDYCGTTVACLAAGFSEFLGTASAGGFYDSREIPLALTFSPVHFIQYDESGRITGTIRDSFLSPGAPVEGIIVHLLNHKIDTTDALGQFSFEAVLPATYTLSFTHPELEDTTIEVAIGVSDTVDLNFYLPIGLLHCSFIPGDINGDGNIMGSDVTFAVRYFKGTGNAPPRRCWYAATDTWLYSAGDVNGDCRFIGSDVTYLVGYFKGINTIIRFCPFTPPSDE